MELLGSFYSLITSVEQLQSNFLLNPDKYSEGELSTPPRKLLNSLRYYSEGELSTPPRKLLNSLGYYSGGVGVRRAERLDTISDI